MMTPKELDNFISENIQGVFSEADIMVLKEEIEKLTPGQVHIQIGVDEGRSLYVAHYYANPGVYIYGIDIIDPAPRTPFMEKTVKMVGMGKNTFYIHGDADTFGLSLLQGIKCEPFVDLLFVDGYHDYVSITNNMTVWNHLMKKGGIILYHDYDHPDTKRFLDEQYGDNKEVLHNKIVRVMV